MTRARVLVVAATAVLLVLVVGAAFAMTRSTAPSGRSSTSTHTTARVEHGDLTERTSYAGTLGYGASQELTAGSAGTLTRVPTAGQVIDRDGELYRVDEHPVRAMIGDVPVYRPLATGLRGDDVRQLNDNLAALGYTTAWDDRFGKGTLAAVQRYQKDRGLPVTGTLGAADIAFVPSAVRIASVTATVGQAAAGPVFAYTADERVVTFSVPAVDADRVLVGTPVTARINGTGEPISGTVVDAAPEQVDGKDVVTATVRLDPVDRELPSAGSTLVEVTGQTRSGVLSVPVMALLPGARPDEYVVEVERGETTKRIPVTTGLVADGRVEIAGRVTAEDRVVVPS